MISLELVPMTDTVEIIIRWYGQRIKQIFKCYYFCIKINILCQWFYLYRN